MNAKKELRETCNLKKNTITSLNQVIAIQAANSITRELLGSDVIENIFDFLRHAQEDYQRTKNQLAELEAMV